MTTQGRMPEIAPRPTQRLLASHDNPSVPDAIPGPKRTTLNATSLLPRRGRHTTPPLHFSCGCCGTSARRGRSITPRLEKRHGGGPVRRRRLGFVAKVDSTVAVCFAFDRVSRSSRGTGDPEVRGAGACEENLLALRWLPSLGFPMGCRAAGRRGVRDLPTWSPDPSSPIRPTTHRTSSPVDSSELCPAWVSRGALAIEEGVSSSIV